MFNFLLLCPEAIFEVSGFPRLSNIYFINIV